MFILLLFNINIYAACPTINADGTCKKSASSKSTTTCNTGYYLDSKNKCVPCPTGCTACTSDTICTECAPGYALTNGGGLCSVSSNPSDCPLNSSTTGTGETISYTEWHCLCASFSSPQGSEIPVSGPNITCATACADYYEDIRAGITLTETSYSKTTASACKCLDSSYSWDSVSNSCILRSQCPAGASSTPGAVPAASWVCSCRCTNLNTNSPCPSRDTYEAAANPTTTDSNECVNKCGPYGKKISQFPYLKSGKENCYCDSGLLWNGTSCSIDKTCPSGSVWCSDGSVSGCFTCPVFPTSISLCNGSKGATIAVQKCERPATANSICYGRTVANGQSTGGWDSQTGLEEDCQCIDVYSASVNPCKK